MTGVKKARLKETNREIPHEMSVTGVVMVDQIKSIDFGARRARFVSTAPSDFLEEILAMLETCIR